MTLGDREGLLARIRQVRSLAATREAHTSDVDPDILQSEQVKALEARLAHLEHLVEGLQDSVHRESERHDKLIAELKAHIQPGAIGTALADDERSRKL